MKNKLREHVGLLVLCTLFFVLGLLRISDRSLLTPDSCQYLLWGNSLAHLQGFVDNTTPEPDKFVNHGPLYSILIAPIELIFPLSVPAVKVWTLFFGISAIILFYFLLLRFFNRTIATVASVFFAFNPILLLYSTEVLSDVPFVVATLASCIFFFKQQEETEKQNLFYVLLIIGIIAATVLREIGLSLVAVVVLMYALRKDWKRALIIAGCVAVALGMWNIRNHLLVEKTFFSQTGNSPWVFDHIMTSSDTSFLYELLVRYWYNLNAYSNFLSGLMFYPTFATQQLSTIFSDASWLYQYTTQLFETGRYFIFFLFLPTFFLGLISPLQQSNTPLLQNSLTPQHISTRALLLLFIPAYLLILCIFPFNDIRYMLPLVPFILFFCLMGLKYIVSRFTWFDFFKRKVFAIMLAGVVIIPNAISISEMIRHNINSNKANALPWNEIGYWIQQNTPEKSVIASPIKDLALFSGGERKVFLMYPNIEVPRFEFSLRDYQAEYLLSPHSFEDATMFEMNMLESSRFTFEHVYTAGNLHLYKIHSTMKEPSRIKFNVANTRSISGHLVIARRFILQEQYDNAEQLLDSIVALAPFRPDVLFQQLICSSLQRNEAKAHQVYQQLTALPSDVGIYIQPAQRQLELLRLLRDAESSTSDEYRSVKTLKAASGFWNLGYYNRASSLMDALLSDSSQYFEGLLWGTHFAIQRGDVKRAKLYHQQLWGLDSLNTLVHSYRKILALNDSLVTDTSSRSRSLRHLALAKVYQSIELKEEAIDEAERALGNAMGNKAALDFYQMLLKNKRTNTF
ncbi:MAG: glycosyltransferase family 39 protein [Ignavibacteriae bacterium]|nr:glycosyltransferase family 39 protein [Ignavibacteriota bacterium]